MENGQSRRLFTAITKFGMVVQVHGPEVTVEKLAALAEVAAGGEFVFGPEFKLFVVGPTCPHCARSVPHTVGG